MRHDYYRPAGARRLRAGLDANGRIVAWDCHLVNLSRNSYRRGTTPAWSTETYGSVTGVSNDLGPDFDLDLVPWHIPNVRLQFIEPRSGVATGAWRAPAHVANGFAVETLLDEIASRRTKCRGPASRLYGAAGTSPSPAKILRLITRIGWPRCCGWPPNGAASASGRPRGASGAWRRTTRSAPIAPRSWSCPWTSGAARAGSARRTVTHSQGHLRARLRHRREPIGRRGAGAGRHHRRPGPRVLRRGHHRPRPRRRGQLRSLPADPASRGAGGHRRPHRALDDEADRFRRDRGAGDRAGVANADSPRRRSAAAADALLPRRGSS